MRNGYIISLIECILSAQCLRLPPFLFHIPYFHESDPLVGLPQEEHILLTSKPQYKVSVRHPVLCYELM